MQRFRMTTRVIAVALGVVIAIAALASASAQQEPAHTFYGLDGTPGDTIAILDSMGNEISSATVADGGQWSIDIDRDAVDGVSFTVNGKAAEADITNRGQGLDKVSLTVMAMPEDSMPEDSMPEGEGEGDELSGDDDDLDELEGDDTSMSDDKMDGGKTDFPGTGTGGLADGGISAGLIGLLIALGVAAVAGLGLRKVKNRI